MTKKIKLLAIICVMCLCSIFLSSCEYIDDLRDNQAVIVNDENGRKIVKNGKSYVKLEGMEDYYDVRNLNTIRLTKQDVPILLSKTYGYNAGYSEDNDMFVFNGEIYCAEDMYDYYMDYDREEKFGSLVTGFGSAHFITPEENELINRIWNDDSLIITPTNSNQTTTEQVSTVTFDICNGNQTLYSKEFVTLIYYHRSTRCLLRVSRRVGDSEYGYSEYVEYEAQSFDKRDLWRMVEKYKQILSEDLKNNDSTVSIESR